MSDRILSVRDHIPKKRYVTKPEMDEAIIAGMGAGSLAMGAKVYHEVMEETTRMLAEMEARLVARFSDLSLKIDAAYQPLLGVEADLREDSPEVAAQVWGVVESLQAIKAEIDA